MVLSKRRAEEIGYEVLREYTADAIEKSRPKPFVLEKHYQTTPEQHLYKNKGGKEVPVTIPAKSFYTYTGDCCKCGEELVTFDEYGNIDSTWGWCNYCPQCGQAIDWAKSNNDPLGICS